MVEGGHLFFAKKNGTLDNEQHLAEMVSLMGPPPLEFLKSDKCRRFWDEKGKIIFLFNLLVSAKRLQETGRAVYPYRISLLK